MYFPQNPASTDPLGRSRPQTSFLLLLLVLPLAAALDALAHLRPHEKAEPGPAAVEAAADHVERLCQLGLLARVVALAPRAAADEAVVILQVLLPLRRPLAAARIAVAELGTLGDVCERAEAEARRRGALLISANAARHLAEHLADKERTYTPLLYCWRGGMRSNSLAHILRSIGWRARVLDGGYKAFRKYVSEDLEKRLSDCFGAWVLWKCS